jgi:hypothetical protein
VLHQLFHPRPRIRSTPHADLQAKNLRCWFAPEDLKIGDRFQGRIEESIRHMKVKRFFE